MDQETAKTLFKEGAFLFLLDFPVGSEVGIDLESWNTGEKFKGIKMIPPGNHFVYYSVANKEGQTAPRSGFFIHLQKKEVVVKRWDPKTEDFVDDASQLEALKSNLESLDTFLGPYPYDVYKRWISLSHRISREVIENIEPLSKRINSVADLIPSKTFQQKHRHRDSKKVVELESKDEAAEPTKLSTTADDFLLPEMHHRPGTNLRFTEIPAKRFPEGASLQEITTYSLDSTHILKQLLSGLESPLLLLGELQFAFLTFLVGQSYLGFEQWKQLVNTIAASDKAIMEIPEFFLEFLNDLFFQLSEVSEDFFVDIVSQNNFLVQTLHTLFSNIDECPEAGQLDKESPLKTLKKRAAKLREHLERRFRWDFGVEPDDEAPALIYVMYSCIFVLALVGNGLVVGVVFSTHRKWTVTNYFILNLALSDILMAVVCIPFSFVTTLILQYWPFGEVMCRLVSYSQAVSVFVSSYTMVVISADRYVAIIYPLRPRMTRRQAKVIMLICWALALVVALPIIVTSTLTIPSPAYEARELYICIEQWSDATLKHNYNMALLVAQYVLPLSVLLFSYGRIAFELWGKRVPGEANVKRDRRMAESKRKIVKMMMTVVVVFAFCWLPLNVFLVVLDTYRDIDQWPGISYVWFVCHWLAMSHSSYNPFIYCCYHSRFRQGLLSVASRCGCKRCFPVAESFDGMDAEPLQRGNTCTSYASHNSSLRFHRGSTLRPLLSHTSQMGHGSVYNGRSHTASFRTSARCNSESEAMPVMKSSFKSLDTRRPSDINEAGLLPDPAVLKDEAGTMNNCKLLFRSNLKRRLSQGKVEMQVFSENDSG